MTEEATREAEAPTRPRTVRRGLIATTVSAVLLILFGVPWWTLVFWGTDWPVAVEVIGTIVFAAALVLLPLSMRNGQARGSDRWSLTGDVILGGVWIVFVWSVLSIVLRLALFSVDDPARGRIVAVTAAIVMVGLLAWGHREAMRVPRVREVDITLDRLGPGLDGLRVILLTDTHFGPIDRTRWSEGIVARVNELKADVVCHVGDIADGTPDVREKQAAPLQDVQAELARVYVTGNHEYFSEAQAWLDRMDSLGWSPLHNEHLTITRGGDSLVIAGVDDRTARGSGVVGHGADLAVALDGTDTNTPVFLLAHQPKQIPAAVQAGVDLQVSGHTHGGQIWPFNILVRLDQPVVHGLSKHGDRTQLYTSRGTGFWGPPFRVFAPSEITLLTLRANP